MMLVMDQSTVEFLRAEYDAAWAHIRDIDGRRLQFVEFYISLNAILATVMAAIITRDHGSMFTFGNFTLVAIGTAVIIGAALTIRGMLQSERQANIRFRRRSNYIRGIFLSQLPDERIKGYLEHHADLNTPTDKTENFDPRGSTLSWVYRLIFGGLAAWVVASLIMLLLACVN
jgi:hypothetical protein